MFANKKFMKIAGFEKCSFVDYENHISCVVFTQGCNMNCFYCHNKELIPCHSDKELIQEKEIFQFLEKRKKYLDAVVISGGEPAMQIELEDFIKDVKKMGFKVKLDTNGTNPKVIENVISKKLIDYVAMDIKAPFKRYEEFSGVKADINCIKESKNILMQGLVDYEFRTTLAPGLGLVDVLQICNEIEGAKTYILQKCRGFDDIMSKPISFKDIVEKTEKKVKSIGTRGVEISA